MIKNHRKEFSNLLIGDLAVFALSLWISLFVRYFEFPSVFEFIDHIKPFSILFILWILVFFIAGLYDKHTSVFKAKLPEILTKAQFVNFFIAVLFFYFIPNFGISPKTNLFIYLIISLFLVSVWRTRGTVLIFGKRDKEKAVIIGTGKSAKELLDEVNSNERYGFVFKEIIDTSKFNSLEIETKIHNSILEKVNIVVIDFNDKKVEEIMPLLYKKAFSKILFVDLEEVYEEIFDKIPLDLVRYDWILRNISVSKKPVFEFMKRSMDIVISILISFIFLFVLPLVWISLKLEGIGDGIWSFQTRVGKNGRLIKLSKFRTMTFSDDGGKWENNKIKNTVTNVGAFLRRMRLDELPQVINVIKGDLSLIGPRPEFQEAVSKYSEELSYYEVRHSVKPGLSGWAQIYHQKHPHHGLDIEETKNKLSYDLYYIKNRSIWLDLKIALRTIKVLISLEGR